MQKPEQTKGNKSIKLYWSFLTNRSNQPWWIFLRSTACHRDDVSVQSMVLVVRSSKDRGAAGRFGAARVRSCVGQDGLGWLGSEAAVQIEDGGGFEAKGARGERWRWWPTSRLGRILELGARQASRQAFRARRELAH